MREWAFYHDPGKRPDYPAELGPIKAAEFVTRPFTNDGYISIPMTDGLSEFFCGYEFDDLLDHVEETIMWTYPESVVFVKIAHAYAPCLSYWWHLQDRFAWERRYHIPELMHLGWPRLPLWESER